MLAWIMNMGFAAGGPVGPVAGAQRPTIIIGIGTMIRSFALISLTLIALGVF